MSVQLKTLATAMTKREELRLERLSAEIKLQTATYCQRAEARLELMHEQLFSLVERRLEREKSRLEVMQRSVEALSPKRIMELGFAVVRSGGKVLKRVGDAEAGAPIEVELADGTIKARIEQ